MKIGVYMITLSSHNFSPFKDIEMWSIQATTVLGKYSVPMKLLNQINQLTCLKITFLLKSNYIVFNILFLSRFYFQLSLQIVIYCRQLFPLLGEFNGQLRMKVIFAEEQN